MIEHLENIVHKLIESDEPHRKSFIFNPLEQFREDRTDDVGIATTLNAAFLIALAGRRHPEYDRARNYLNLMLDSSEWGGVARFYLEGLHMIQNEIHAISRDNPDFLSRLRALSQWVSHGENLRKIEETTEKLWSFFCPEATGIKGHIQESVKALQKKRTVTITQMNPTPITDPIHQVLFTSNVLLTVPPSTISINSLPFSDQLKERLTKAMSESQLYWYDHPIQIGVEQEKNEILYGLRNLDAAVEFECVRGNLNGDSTLNCLLSASVTHRRLKDVVRMYLEEELSLTGTLKNINVYVFTEADTDRIIGEVLAPAAKHYLGRDDADEQFNMFGVDGEYGRHYSFLKGISAFWQCFIDRKIRATFKIDLDQVFPQEDLIEETDSSAFEHLMTPLWGGRGVDSDGQYVELGMIAGALVNERDVCNSIFCPDVTFPERKLSPDEYIFFSVLPQALSTEAEMMTRYGTSILDGNEKCIQRIHVTGGTNGILIDSLRRHRPFTPSFIGRAEDQAYLFSTFPNPGTKLAYVHKDGLIMRHDKEAFAQEAIHSAYVGKLVGDHVRILLFSAYARLLTNHIHELKEKVDPFTGCFISDIPNTVVHLCFALKAGSLFCDGLCNQGVEFIKNGAMRITDTLEFIQCENNRMKHQYEKERLGWNLYYDTLSAFDDALKREDKFALTLQKKALDVVNNCLVRFGT
ncbi:MAG: hypothetical protein SVY10_18580 [Thermodesulfobacteriota bacterium]|nr:hypothetical protein [Thermodesulfobacteriota bacterium]